MYYAMHLDSGGKVIVNLSIQFQMFRHSVDTDTFFHCTFGRRTKRMPKATRATRGTIGIAIRVMCISVECRIAGSFLADQALLGVEGLLEGTDVFKDLDGRIRVGGAGGCRSLHG